MPNEIDLWGLIDKGGVIALLLIGIVAAVRGWIVFGWYYDEVRRDRDEWKDFALRGVEAAQKGTSVAERSLDIEDLINERIDVVLDAERRKRRRTT